MSGAVDLDAVRALTGRPPRVDRPRGPDDDGGMEARIERLERFAETTTDRLARIEVTLAHVDREVSQTKWWIIGQIVALFVAVVGTGVAIQQMTVATFQGAAQQQRDAQPAASTVQPIVIQVPAAPARASSAP